MHQDSIQQDPNIFGLFCVMIFVGFGQCGGFEALPTGVGGIGTVRDTGVDMSDNKAMCFWADGRLFACGGNYVSFYCVK